jgi:uncharacterized protein DUF4440
MRGPAVVTLAILTASGAAAVPVDTTGTLLRQTQELYDALAPGDKTPWERYLDPDVIYADENGTVADKAQILEQMAPLPKGTSGTIKVTEFTAQIRGSVAVTNYVADETEMYHGQELHAKYLSTDTWLDRKGAWRMIGSETLAMQQDPPAVTLADADLDQYVGTYAASPDYTYTIARTNDGLTGQATNGSVQPLKAELRDVLFVPGQPRSRKIFERDGNGAITAFAARREGRDVIWTKQK